MEQTQQTPSIFSPADLGLIVERLLRSPARIRPGAAALLGLAAVCLGLLGDGLFYGTRPGINIPIWHAAVVATLLLAARPCKIELAPRQLALIGLSLVVSSLIAWRGSEPLHALDLAAAAFLMLLAVSLPPRLGARRMGFVTFLFALTAGALSMATGGLRLAMLTPWREHLDQVAAGNAAAVVRALLLALPLIVVFGGLFIAADAVFESQARRLVDPDWKAFVPHLFWFSACSLAAAGVFWCALGFETPDSPTADLSESRRLKTIETGIVLGALALLFALFVAVQLRYLFGGSDLVQSTLDLTYAEYARRGFFELVIASALLLPVLLIMNWARRREGSSATVYRVLAVILIALLGVVMASALERLRIYSDTFGLTELRVYAGAFLLWLAAVFLCFTATVLRNRIGEFLLAATVLGAIALVALNAISPDALIARTNTSRLDEGRSFDAQHAAMLGADAVPVLIARLDQLPAADRCFLASALLEEWSDKQNDARGWNRGRARAIAAVEDNEARLRDACP